MFSSYVSRVYIVNLYVLMRLHVCTCVSIYIYITITYVYVYIYVMNIAFCTLYRGMYTHVRELTCHISPYSKDHLTLKNHWLIRSLDNLKRWFTKTLWIYNNDALFCPTTNTAPFISHGTIIVSQISKQCHNLIGIHTCEFDCDY